MIKPKKSITIGLTGDVMIGRLVNDHLNSVPPAYLWGNVLPFLHKTDLNLINLEAALTNSGKRVEKVFNFKSHPHHVQSLFEGRVDVVNLANNHVLDYAEEGLLETLDALDKAKILHVGAGRNLIEAKHPVIISRNGFRIGILGCSDNEPSWVAGENSPGIHFLTTRDFHLIHDEVVALRRQVDLLILTIHWGPNMRERPPKHFVEFAHALVLAGVDILHGHSAHIFQGVEVYEKKLILYDTGDFVDDYYVDPQLRNDRSFLFIVEFTRDGISSLRLIPVLISNFQTNVAQDVDATEAIRRMQGLSKEMGTHFIEKDGELLLKLK